MDLNNNRALEFWSLPLESLTQVLVQFRVARFPNLVTHPDTTELDVTFPKLDRAQACSVADFINSPALLFFLRMPGIKHTSVSGLQRRFQLDLPPFPFDCCHFSQINSTL